MIILLHGTGDDGTKNRKPADVVLQALFTKFIDETKNSPDYADRCKIRGSVIEVLTCTGDFYSYSK